MFDEFHFLGSTSELVTCAAGHPQRGGLQTKDLECLMSHFYVLDSNVFEGLSGVNEGRTKVEHRVENGELVIAQTSRYIPALRLDGGFSIYTHCDECEPVFYESEHAFRGGIDKSQPWCQWIVVIQKGKLIEVQKDRCETREDVKAKMGRVGCAPLPDNDRMVKRELELWRKDRARS